VQVLHVKHIVVLGHAQCGGIKALVQDSAPLSPGDFIGRWMSLLQPTLEATPRGRDEAIAEFTTRLEQKAISRSLDNLMTFPCINILVGRGKLQLHGAYFGVAQGSLAVLDQSTGQFKPVNGSPGRAA
jgi:carbonic anhydrase